MTVVATRDQLPQIVKPAPGLSRGSAQQAQGITGREVMAIIRKRKWLIIITVLSCLILSAGATGLWLKLGPLWTAETMVEVEPPVSSGIIRAEASEDIMKRLVQSNTRKVTASDILDKALQSNELKG